MLHTVPLKAKILDFADISLLNKLKCSKVPDILIKVSLKQNSIAVVKIMLF